MGALKDLRGNAGAAALEALLSIVLLFVVIYTMWSVAVLIYNHSKLTTATQFSAQAALVTYDRSTYRGRNVAGLYERAVNRASTVAQNVFRENTCGMLADPATGKRPLEECGRQGGSTAFRLDIDCSPSLWGSAWNPWACFMPNNPEAARAVRATVTSEAEHPYFFLTPFRNGSLDGGKQDRLARMRASARAFGYSATAPEATP